MNIEKWNELQEYLPILSDLNIDICYLFMTTTAFEKSIIDATIPVTNFFKKNNIHDYTLQEQGSDFKKNIKSKIILNNSLFEFDTSVYRPITKKGDNRLWFNGLKRNLTIDEFGPESFIAMTCNENYLYIFNLSDESIQNSILEKEFVYQKLLEISEEQDKTANELLDKIKAIYSEGFIPTIRNGDTGVGMTLENKLDIPPNSSRKPDYKGIELKAFRNNEGSIPSRKTLFSQVPNWENSKLKSTKEILDKFGYWDDVKKRIALKITIKANNFNRQGFLLKINENDNKLYVLHKTEGIILEWNIDDLKNALLKKHHETFWIEAKTKWIDGIEHFNYKKVTHTKNPQVNLFEYLIDSRMISLDFTMHIKENGSARDHGYLFKMDERNINKLFPKSIEYDLSNL